MSSDSATTPLFILYGSATGNAEHIAKDLATSYKTGFFSSVVCCELDQYKKKCQDTWDTDPTTSTGGMQMKHGVIVISSTTGNGDAPENASRFVRYCKRKTTVATQPFQHLTYAVLALGDTNYDQFCNAGKVIDKKMAELGGTRAVSLVCADEATGLEESVDPWTASIIDKITVACRCRTGENGMTDITPTVPVVADDGSLEEEKKMEFTDEPTEEYTANARKAINTEPSNGVTVVKTLAEQIKVGDVAINWETSPASSELPKVGAPRITSVVFKDTVAVPPNSAAPIDEDEMMYTFDKPYVAPIRTARYLTQTTIEPTSAILTLSDLHEQFPLEGNAAERNEKRVVEVTLGLPSDDTFAYQPGDAIGMMVTNDDDDVAYILGLLHHHHGLAADQLVSLDDNDTMTVRRVISQHIDLTWWPLQQAHKRVLYAFSQQAVPGPERCVLEWLATPAGEALYQLYIVDQRRSVVDLLKDFPSLQAMSFTTLVGILPALVPRYYSVTSSPKVTPTTLTIALAVVDYLTPSLQVNGQEIGKRRISGLASQYLERVARPWSNSTTTNGGTTTPEVTVQIFPKPTADFRLPASLATPLILIGPGTGVAPFVGFLQHRQACADGVTTPGSVDLFFGCRHGDHDFLYQSELEVLQQNGVLTRLHTAFSRDGPTKVYVQNIMQQQSDMVCDLLLRQEAAVFICGDGNHMAKAVQAALQSILRKELGDDVKAAEYMVQMKKDHRLLLDIWS